MRTRPPSLPSVGCTAPSLHRSVRRLATRGQDTSKPLQAGGSGAITKSNIPQLARRLAVALGSSARLCMPKLQMCTLVMVSALTPAAARLPPAPRARSWQARPVCRRGSRARPRSPWRGTGPTLLCNLLRRFTFQGGDVSPALPGHQLAIHPAPSMQPSLSRRPCSAGHGMTVMSWRVRFALTTRRSGSHM